MVLVFEENENYESFKSTFVGKKLFIKRMKAKIDTEEVYTLDGDLVTKPKNPKKVYYVIEFETSNIPVTEEDIFTEFL